ncbi:replication protein A 70 kDa DNA-binding subunit B-like [Nicotiana tabacum]|uniref:Replication protein A 70 kDa DNA-binding subunit B-like n=1 Tax=Nicotiana tabacum TaxID=4097 RepID=A0AC58TCQ2_TOBAC
MANEEELGKMCIPISKLKKYATEWVIKVLVIRRGLIKEYKNEKGESVRWQLIFVDEEGTKIQTTLFNIDVQLWKNFFDQNKIYYIINGKISGTKPNFLSVHKDLEVAFNSNTEIIQCNTEFMYQQFSNGFISLDESEQFTTEIYFVKELNGEGRSRRREVIVTNERYDRKTLTLWGDLAEIEGELLESIENSKSVVAFSDVKSSTYQGDFVLSTTPVSSVLIYPTFEKAKDLTKWNDNMKASNLDISLMPSRLMQIAREVKITDIVDGSIVSLKFKAKITDINSNHDPWYHACKKCHRRVTVIKSTATCGYCKIEDIDYDERYRLKFDVSAEEQYISITLFDGARYFFGCDVKEYVGSTSEKKEESKYYRKLVLSKGKEFSILVKIDRKIAKEDRNSNLVAEEIHEVIKDDPTDEIDVDAPLIKLRRKRSKKNKDTIQCLIKGQSENNLVSFVIE